MRFLYMIFVGLTLVLGGCAVIPASMSVVAGTDAGDMYTSTKAISDKSSPTRTIDMELTVLQVLQGSRVPGEPPVSGGEANPIFDTLFHTNYPTKVQYVGAGVLEIAAQTGIIIATLPVPPLSLALAGLFAGIGILDMRCNEKAIKQEWLAESYLTWKLQDWSRIQGLTTHVSNSVIWRDKSKPSSFLLFTRQVGADIATPFTCGG